MAAPKKEAAVKESAPEAPTSDSVEVKTITLESPWGTKVNVAADQADVFKDAGYTK